MNTPVSALDRDLLLTGAKHLATRARRARLIGALTEIRTIGQQLDALDPAAPEAPDVIDAAAMILNRHADTLELIGA
jgi:hypothetical protein